MTPAVPPFSRLVADAMTLRGLGLRELSRRAGIDPSLLSKVLAGKRNPPTEEESLRRLAEALQLDPIELIVAAGLIPSDWGALKTDAELLRSVHAVATGRRPAPARRPDKPASAPRSPREERSSPPPILPGGGLSEELL